MGDSVTTPWANPIACRDTSDGIRCALRPLWVDDRTVDKCRSCQRLFSFAFRRHHCRHCGHVMCALCCYRKRPLQYLQYFQPVRVCHACFIKCNNADALMAAVRNDHVDRIKALAELVDVDFAMGFYTPLAYGSEHPIAVAGSRSCRSDGSQVRRQPWTSARAAVSARVQGGCGGRGSAAVRAGAGRNDRAVPRLRQDRRTRSQPDEPVRQRDHSIGCAP